VEHIESASPPKSRHGADIAKGPGRASNGQATPRCAELLRDDPYDSEFDRTTQVLTENQPSGRGRALPIRMMEKSSAELTTTS